MKIKLHFSDMLFVFLYVSLKAIIINFNLHYILCILILKVKFYLIIFSPLLCLHGDANISSSCACMSCYFPWHHSTTGFFFLDIQEKKLQKHTTPPIIYQYIHVYYSQCKFGLGGDPNLHCVFEFFFAKLVEILGPPTRILNVIFNFFKDLKK